jgi:diguanylate cyclase (GGDEF)-like protein
VARWGGEEFAVVLPGVDAEQAWPIAQAMAEGVQGLGLRHETSESAATVTISIGVATLEPRLIREPIDNLVARADAALYDAKRKGRNRVGRQSPSTPNLASH